MWALEQEKGQAAAEIGQKGGNARRTLDTRFSLR
jgi:hypothetical protein